MNRSHSLLLLVAIGLLALALPGSAAAKARDRNHDGIPDRWEKRHHLSTTVNQARRDQDHDHLRNRAEFEAGTNPRDSDSDNDGIPDGQEHAGTIASFDPTTGELTIDLFGGGSVSGLVTEETEIECDESGGEASASDSSGEDEGSDDNQDGNESGDDDGQENESGDGDGQDGPNNSNCATADLEPGATVDEAELELENGMAVFEKVELTG
jgi:hypothetical protein